MANEALVNFENGKLVTGRWKILGRLGAGGCGAVFKVEDTKRKGFFAALKAEKRQGEDDGVLKIEANMLRKLQERKNVMKLYQYGRRPGYNFIVMSLYGQDLYGLKRSSPLSFSESTILRIAVNVLYAIKQVHELGFVHRDVKPGNVMNGAVGHEKRMFYLIDYGLARCFVEKVNGILSVRKPRNKVLLRGTLRYCSLGVHERKEHGRVDDLWALLFMLTELYVGLPWNGEKDEEKIRKMKQTLTPVVLFKECPQEFPKVADYLRTVKVNDRPDYWKLYEIFNEGIQRGQYSYYELYEWEPGAPKTVQEDEERIANGYIVPEVPPILEGDVITPLEISDREKKTKKPLSAAEIQVRIYPTTNPEAFKEKILSV